MTTRYYVDRQPDPLLLLHRSGHVDEKFLNGERQPTLLIVDWEFGHNDSADGLIEAKAGGIAPASLR